MTNTEDLVNIFDIDVPGYQADAAVSPHEEDIHLEHVQTEFKKESLFHDPEYVAMCKRDRLEGKDIDNLLTILERHGGFSDVVIASEEYIVRKRDKKIVKLLTRPVSNEEMKGLIEHMYDMDRYFHATKPGKEVDESYQVHSKQFEHPLRNRVNICSFQTRFGTGVKITLRELPAVPPSYDDLGVPSIIREHATPRQGLVCVAGETGSGKSTLCASIIRAIKENANEHRLTLTYERPIEFVYHHISGFNPVYQHTVGEFGDFKTFHEGLVNALRCTPEVIFLGESRERETFMTLPKIAESGHLGLTTMHAKSVSHIFSRIANEVDPSFSDGIIRQTVQYMQLAVYQWLAPTIDGKVTAIQEILVFTDEVKKEILSHPPEKLTSAIQAAVLQHGISFERAAKKALDEKIISQKTYDVAIAS